MPIPGILLKDLPTDRAEDTVRRFKESGLSIKEFSAREGLNWQSLRTRVAIDRKPSMVHRKFTAEQRLKIVESYLASGLSAKAFAVQWEISSTTLGNWAERFQSEGLQGLESRPQPPRRAGDRRLGPKVPLAVREEILATKRAEPSFGFRRIRDWLFRTKGLKVSAGTVRNTVQAEGLPNAQRPKRRRRGSDAIKRFERARPMQLWQSDITQFNLARHGTRAYLTVFMDDHSRFIVGWRLQSRQTSELVLDAYRDACAKYGRPEEVLTDQGRQYFAWRGKSDLEKLLEADGVKHIVSRAHHPQTLGKCERFWETVKVEFWHRAKPADLDEARERLKHYFDFYNHQRPHQGLQGSTPADRFFGMAGEVRAAIEKQVQKNSYAMAIGQRPRPPAFLIGQIGEQRIAFHGEGGRFLLTHESMPSASNGDLHVHASTNADDTRDRNLTHIPSGVGELNDKRIGTDEVAKLDAGEGCATGPLEEPSQVPGDPGARALGASERRTEVESPSDRGEDCGVLGGPQDEGSGGHRAQHEAASLLAATRSGDCGADGWPIDATKETRGDGETSPRRGSEETFETHPRA